MDPEIVRVGWCTVFGIYHAGDPHIQNRSLVSCSVVVRKTLRKDFTERVGYAGNGLCCGFIEALTNTVSLHSLVFNKVATCAGSVAAVGLIRSKRSCTS